MKVEKLDSYNGSCVSVFFLGTLCPCLAVAFDLAPELAKPSGFFNLALPGSGFPREAWQAEEMDWVQEGEPVMESVREFEQKKPGHRLATAVVAGSAFHSCGVSPRSGEKLSKSEKIGKRGRRKGTRERGKVVGPKWKGHDIAHYEKEPCEAIVDEVMALSLGAAEENGENGVCETELLQAVECAHRRSLVLALEERNHQLCWQSDFNLAGYLDNSANLPCSFVAQSTRRFFVDACTHLCNCNNVVCAVALIKELAATVAIEEALAARRCGLCSMLVQLGYLELLVMSGDAEGLPMVHQAVFLIKYLEKANGDGHGCLDYAGQIERLINEVQALAIERVDQALAWLGTFPCLCVTCYLGLVKEFCENYHDVLEKNPPTAFLKKVGIRLKEKASPVQARSDSI